MERLPFDVLLAVFAVPRTLGGFGLDDLKAIHSALAPSPSHPHSHAHVLAALNAAARIKVRAHGALLGQCLGGILFDASRSDSEEANGETETLREDFEPLRLGSWRAHVLARPQTRCRSETSFPGGKAKESKSTRTAPLYAPLVSNTSASISSGSGHGRGIQGRLRLWDIYSHTPAETDASLVEIAAFFSHLAAEAHQHELQRHATPPPPQPREEGYGEDGDEEEEEEGEKGNEERLFFQAVVLAALRALSRRPWKRKLSAAHVNASPTAQTQAQAQAQADASPAPPTAGPPEQQQAALKEEEQQEEEEARADLQLGLELQILRGALRRCDPLRAHTTRLRAAPSSCAHGAGAGADEFECACACACACASRSWLSWYSMAWQFVSARYRRHLTRADVEHVAYRVILFSLGSFPFTEIEGASSPSSSSASSAGAGAPISVGPAHGPSGGAVPMTTQASAARLRRSTSGAASRRLSLSSWLPLSRRPSSAGSADTPSISSSSSSSATSSGSARDAYHLQPARVLSAQTAFFGTQLNPDAVLFHLRESATAPTTKEYFGISEYLLPPALARLWASWLGYEWRQGGIWWHEHSASRGAGAGAGAAAQPGVESTEVKSEEEGEDSEEACKEQDDDVEPDCGRSTRSASSAAGSRRSSAAASSSASVSPFTRRLRPIEVVLLSHARWRARTLLAALADAEAEATQRAAAQQLEEVDVEEMQRARRISTERMAQCLEFDVHFVRRCSQIQSWAIHGSADGVPSSPAAASTAAAAGSPRTGAGNNASMAGAIQPSSPFLTLHVAEHSSFAAPQGKQHSFMRRFGQRLAAPPAHLPSAVQADVDVAVAQAWADILSPLRGMLRFPPPARADARAWQAYALRVLGDLHAGSDGHRCCSEAPGFVPYVPLRPASYAVPSVSRPSSSSAAAASSTSTPSTRAAAKAPVARASSATKRILVLRAFASRTSNTTTSHVWTAALGLVVLAMAAHYYFALSPSAPAAAATAA